jgi:hypothetical protein
MKEEENNIFLRHGLSPKLKEYNCACLMAHHHPKPKQADREKTLVEYSYAGAGWAVITNWARATLTIDSTPASTVFKFVASKRGERIGWERERERFYCHSDKEDQLMWVEKPKQETDKKIAQAKIQQGQRKFNLMEVLGKIPIDGVTLSALAQVCGAKVSSMQKVLEKLILLNKVEKHDKIYYRIL